MASQLEQLRKITTVVSDTGDIQAVAKWKPVDATTNPSLLLKAAGDPGYAPLIDEAVSWAKGKSKDRQQQLTDASDYLAVQAGLKILDIVPGRVSTEVDARLSFDTDVLSLLPHDGRVLQSFRRFLSRFGSLDQLYVVFTAAEVARHGARAIRRERKVGAAHSVHPPGEGDGACGLAWRYAGRCARRKERIWRTASGTRSFGSFHGNMLTSAFGASIAVSMATA